MRTAIQELGYTHPTDIQRKVIPRALDASQNNFLVCAPTGSGKTEAAFFPVLNSILSEEEDTKRSRKGFKVLYIAPLRALNRDILVRMLPLLSKKLSLRVSVRNSDTSSSKRRKQAKDPPDILVTTPETFQILFCGKLLRRNLKTVKWVIIDEFHSIIDSKRGVQLSIGLERLKRLSPNIQIVGLGAGIQNERKALNFLTGGRGGEIITGGEKREYSIEVMAVPPKLKVRDSPLGFEQEVRLRQITNKIAKIVREEAGKVLVFSNTRTTTELIGAFMKADHPNINSAVHHSSLGSDVRKNVEENFKSGDLDCVIATSSLELGIDIGRCDLVVQVLSPRRIEIALQRVGRSKHSFGKTARGVIMAGTPDSLFESLGVAELSGKELEPKRILEKSYDVLAHQVVGMLRGQYLENGEYLPEKEVFNTIIKAWPYRNLSKSEFGAILRFLDRRVGLINVNGKNLSLSSGAIQYYFQHLSTIPSVVKYDVVDIETGKKVGELDQKFVLEVESGDIFLLSGVPREILEIKVKEGKILTRSSGTSALPPKWEGDLIPVSWKLAEYVGQRRRDFRKGNAVDQLPASKTAKNWVKEIVTSYPGEKRYPDPYNLVVEADAPKGLIVVHSPFGTKVNNTLALLLKEFLSEDRDFPIVGVESDAYRIFLHTFKSNFMKEKAIFESIEQALNKTIDYCTDKQEFTRLVSNAVITSKTKELGWFLIQVLERFGMLSGKTRLRKSQIARLVGSYRGTPPLKEAVREYIFSHMELEKTRELLKEIGKTRDLWFTTGLSSLGLGAPSNFSTDVKDLERIINEKYEKRLLNKRLKFVCLSCGYSEIRPAKKILTECPECSSSLISVVKRHKELERIVEKAKQGKLTEEEKKELLLAHKVSRFMKSRGELTSKAIATTGVGPKQALSIVRRHSADVRRLIEELRKRERNYWQYHHIWED